MNGMIRQGDVLLVPVEKCLPPPEAQRSKEIVLALGEVTGHAHRLAASEIWEWKADGQRYVRVTGSVGTISHEEHDLVPAPVIEPDITYRVIQQKEWDLTNQWRVVRD